jgi:hypothetical protein
MRPDSSSPAERRSSSTSGSQTWFPGFHHSIPDRLGRTRARRIAIMSLVVRFNPTNLTAEKYDESIRRHAEAGVALPPDGMDLHVCFGSNGNLRVSEIWDSRDQLEAYGQQLMPILADVGIELSGEPEIFEVHNIIKR